MTCLACGDEIPDAERAIIGVRDAVRLEFTGEIWHRRCTDIAGMERDAEQWMLPILANPEAGPIP